MARRATASARRRIGATTPPQDLRGTEAYEELAKCAKDPFLSCPLDADLRHELEDPGREIVVHGCAADLSQKRLESWEEIRPGQHFS